MMRRPQFSLTTILSLMVAAVAIVSALPVSTEVTGYTLFWILCVLAHFAGDPS